MGTQNILTNKTVPRFPHTTRFLSCPHLTPSHSHTQTKFEEVAQIEALQQSVDKAQAELAALKKQSAGLEKEAAALQAQIESAGAALSRRVGLLTCCTKQDSSSTVTLWSTASAGPVMVVDPLLGLLQ